MKTFLILISVLISGCATPIMEDGKPARCAAEAWGIGTCYGSTEEGVYRTKKSMLEGEIRALEMQQHNY